MRRPSLEAVLLTLALLLLTGAGAGAWWALGHPRVRRWADLGVRILRTAVAGQLDPGARALRGAGCDTAAVTTLGEFVGLSSGEAVARHVLSEVDYEMPFVFCHLSPAHAPLTCAEVVAVYRTAVPEPPARIALQVTPQQRACDGIYAADGTRLGDLLAPFSVPAGRLTPPRSPASTPPAGRS